MSYATLRALIELQIGCLSPTPSDPIDDAGEVTGEVIEYLGTLSALIQAPFHLGVGQIEAVAGQRFGRPFAELSAAERESVLEEGIWDDALWHGVVSLVVKLGWLVIYSRGPARQRVGFSMPTTDMINVKEPPRPRLDVEYDICVVGSGAGGSVVAARAAEAGRRVLIVDDGCWVSPRDFPTRDDRALRDLYRGSGVQPALPRLDHVLKPGGMAFINVLQARLVGGGPAINNAIHLPIDERRFREWEEYDCPVRWEELRERLSRVADDLGVNSQEGETAGGWRSAVFREAAGRLGLGPTDLPVSIHKCLGCGGCNTGCRFGLKTGGIHGPRSRGVPRSYLERALAAGAEIAPLVEAKHFRGGLGSQVRGLQVRDHVSNRDVTIRAKRYVLAAGPIASSQLLRRSVFQLMSPVGHHLAANVVLPVFATWPSDPPDGGQPDPGLQMCVFVKQDGRLLETWFHYPGSLAAALPEWLRRHVAIMERYRRLAVCGVVVPTDRHGQINAFGNLVLSLSDAELKHLVSGVLSVARVFIEAGAEQVIPSTVRPAYLRPDSFENDKQAFQRNIRGPADLNLTTAHPQGGNAIGRRRSASVVSETFTLYDFKNLFVADASLFPAGCGVNPQMTTMALAHLAADRVLAG